MKTIREICDNKPSVAIRHMLNGLKKANSGEWDRFKIKMFTFGETEDNGNNAVCYGCAATCAMQEISGRAFTAEDYFRHGHKFESVHAAPLGLNESDVTDFEYVIDSFRNGTIHRLLRYFQVPEDVVHELRYLANALCMQNESYMDQFGEVERIIAELEKRGL